MRWNTISGYVVAIVQTARVYLLQQSVLDSSIEAVVSLEWNKIRNPPKRVDNARFQYSTAMYVRSSLFWDVT